MGCAERVPQAQPRVLCMRTAFVACMKKQRHSDANIAPVFYFTLPSTCVFDVPLLALHQLIATNG